MRHAEDECGASLTPLNVVINDDDDVQLAHFIRYTGHATCVSRTDWSSHFLTNLTLSNATCVLRTDR